MEPMNNLARLKHWRYAALAFVFLALVFYWALCYRQRLQALEAIPSQAAAVLYFPSFGQFNAVLHDMPSGVQALSLLQILQKDIQRGLRFLQIDSANTFKAEIRSIAAGFSLQSVDSLHPVIIMDMDQRAAPLELIARIQQQPNTVISNFKGHSIYALRHAGKDQFVAASAGNLFIFSKYSYLVEDALLQLDSWEKWWAQPFGTVSAQPIAFQIAVRPERIAERCKGEMEPIWEAIPDWFSSQIEWLSVRWEDNQWKTTIQTRKNIQPNFNQSGNTDAIGAILPDNTALFLWAGFENRIDLNDLAPGSRTTTDYKNFVEPWIGSEAAFVLIDPYSPDMLEDQFLVFACLNEALAQSSLKNYGDQTGLVKKYNYQTYEVRQFLSQSLIAPLLSKSRPSFTNPVCVVLNGYVVFAASSSAMELWIDKYIVSQTLGNRPDYLLHKQKLPGKGNLQLYLNAAYLPQLVKQIFKPFFFENNAADIHLLQRSGIVGLAMQSDRHAGIQGVFANQALSSPVQDASILWKTTLSAPAITQPFVVPLNVENSERAILIQDNQFQLYRISANGSVRWRKQLDQPIISTVQGIDFYKNGKTCYLFNTADAVWLLDDEGQELVGYPLHLQSPATNGATVVDFDNDQNYRFFLACQNGNLYGFDQFGRPLPGWNPQSGVGRIKHPMVHFKQGEKDYLAALNISGQLFVFHRNGAEHFPAVRFSGTFVKNPPQFDAGKEAPRIVCANDAGRVYVCNLSGQNFSLDLTAGQGEGPFSFVFEGLIGDARKDYAMLCGNKLSISGYEGKAFQKKHSAVYHAQLDTIFDAGCCKRLGALSHNKRKIYLLNAQGEIWPGFPLAGSTQFVLTQPSNASQELVLIVGNMEAVYAYKIK